METKEVVIFLKVAEPFSWGFMQDFINFVDHLKKHDISIDHAYNCITQGKEDRIRAFKEHAKILAQFKKKYCPICGKELDLIRVNNKPSRMVGEGYKTQWYCPNVRNCSYEFYSKKTMREWMNELKHVKER